MTEITSLDEYRDYVNVSRFTIAERETFTKRRWVPNWLWSMIAEPNIDPAKIAEQLETARQDMLNSMLANLDEPELPATSEDSSTSSRTRL